MKIRTAFILALLLIQTTFAQQSLMKTRPAIPSEVIWRFADPNAGARNHDPDKSQIITTDIDNFWRAYDLAAKESSLQKKTEIYQHEYLDKGSPGLQDFVTLRIKSAEALAQTIEKCPRYYASIRQQTQKVAAYSDEIRKGFHRLKAIYADAVFPDVYFVIGRLSTGGTTSKNGLLIGAEMYGLTKGSPTAELNDWLKQVLKSIDTIPAIVAHESVHIQQQSLILARTLLAQSIEEGAADFIGEMMVEQIINKHLHEFGNPKERQLWEEFKPVMNEKSFANWLYNGGAAKDRPADLGYYIGYKICESYYQKAQDKSQAIKDILAVSDFEKFLKDSQYERKFTTP
jgi:hypothetical protein